MACLATEERNGTNREVEIHSVLGRAQALGPEDQMNAHPDTSCLLTPGSEPQLPLFLNREHDGGLPCHMKSLEGTNEMTSMKYPESHSKS